MKQIVRHRTTTLAALLALVACTSLHAVAWNFPEQEVSIQVVTSPYSPYTLLPSFWKVEQAPLISSFLITNTGTEAVENWFASYSLTRAENTIEFIADEFSLRPGETLLIERESMIDPRLSSQSLFMHMVVDNGAGEIVTRTDINCSKVISAQGHTIARDNGDVTGSVSLTKRMGGAQVAGWIGMRVAIPMPTTVLTATFSTYNKKCTCSETRVRFFDAVTGERIATSGTVSLVRGGEGYTSYTVDFGSDGVTLDVGEYYVAVSEQSGHRLELATASNFNGEGMAYTGDAATWHSDSTLTPMLRLEVVNPNSHPGDINDNGVIDGTDLNLLIGVILGWQQPDYYPGDCDVNGDGNVDALDVNRIVRIIMGN